MTHGKVVRARSNADVLGSGNVDSPLSGIGRLPLPDGSVDPVLSNGVFDPCPDRPAVLAEVSLVLRPGGRTRMAEMLREPHVSPDEASSNGSCSDRIAGAVWGRSLPEMRGDPGFVESVGHGRTGDRTSSCTRGALISAKRP
ncbi:arsenite S-adenosylmethyltransferase [Tautonia plasticadhaerens]|uniref:Arsenite S-adenosylmethyltransferase n=2 Tax=Tautonia plasticadhaerens TaxID=2527974 RepID=A0A518H0L0_9BACT|nr:arsenite S-adenosylmethyltransferase [Tautonia plasticadhaerens]